MTSDFFEGLVRWNVERNGITSPLPFRYFDTLSFAAVYTAATAKVRRLFPHPDLIPIELRPGRCLAVFNVSQHGKTDHEPYNVFNIAFLVSYRRRPVPLVTAAAILRSGVVPSYTWQLPETSEFAVAAGVELYGFPKFMADIQISKDAERVVGSVSVAGVELLRLGGPVLPNQGARQFRYVMYSVQGDSLISANWLCNALEYAASLSKARVDLTIGQGHPICETLRGIELARHPMFYEYVPRSEAILFPPRNMRDV